MSFAINKLNTIALIGNPNTGKTSLFNCLTGARQKVGNWPGVTVEKKEGTLLYNNNINIVDLPGTYSIGAHSEDELIARNYIIFDRPSTVINVIDATNLKRNLYLTIQLREMGANVVIALNMMDEAEVKNIKIDRNQLSALLGIPVIPIIAKENQGVKELIKNCDPSTTPFKLNYGALIEKELEKLERALKAAGIVDTTHPLRFYALRLLENDDSIPEMLTPMIYKTKDQQSAADKAYNNLLAIRQDCLNNLKNTLGENLETIFIEKRYKYIDNILEQVMNNEDEFNTATFSDQIDRIVLNKYVGLPIFFLVMLIIFKLTFTISAPLTDFLEAIFAMLNEWLGTIITNRLLSSFLREGIIGGLGAIIVFLPIILSLFFVMSLLESSGYMARGAYITDRFMRAIGLEGKAFIPLVIGLGCNVPAILATRALENRRDSMITILITPLMSCSARLPVYALFVSAFFQRYEGLILFSLYFLGILLAVIMAKIFGVFLFSGKPTPLLVELPPYRWPSIKNTLIQVWKKGISFLKKVGTIILAFVIFIWILSNLPWGVEYAGSESLLGKIGTLIAPLFTPLGFGTREAASSLLFGIVAKEIVVSTLGVLYGTGQEGLVTVISQLWTPLSAYSFMIMTLIYIPCAGTIGAIKAETGSWKWALWAILYTLVLGWIISFLIYQGGLLLGLGS